MKYVDLHTHTIYSDGTNPPEQNVIIAANYGIEVIAITDHDTTAGIERAVKEAEKWGIEVLPGVEISTKVFHILGYGFDVENKQLQELLAQSREYQVEIVRQRTEKLQKQGIPVTLEKVKALHPESRIGKQNIIYTMLKDPECREILKGLSMKEIYEKYLVKPAPAACVDLKKEVSEDDAISAIKSAGGIPIVAHPFKQTKKPEELQRLIDKGIQGLEIQPNYNGRNEAYKKWAKEKRLIITYGSDYHGAIFEHRPPLKKEENQIERFW